MPELNINALLRVRLTEKQLSLLADAYNDFAGKAVTGFISDAFVSHGAVIGVVYGHVRKTADGTFMDGHVIHTSMLLKAWQIGCFSAVQTRNSLYIVASWRAGADEAIFESEGGNSATAGDFPQLTLH
ncbi:hypothetical protein [Pseudomonas japonica]|uniref:hypothetical protein n=1 Tax=Pseudomonas japonica TaxID=256466 RepID=UPI0015E38811|nr:hypothetical protein [Pseudomonas japonica]MBA1244938.1 hypothetical protein [Pseudomonas japonica]